MKDSLGARMQRRSNWRQIVQNTVDQYDDAIHGVQKDAVQNGKDAIPSEGRKESGVLRSDYVKKSWRFSFELKKIQFEGKKDVLVLMMTDCGTTGLTGERRVGDFGPEEEIPLDEKWARFESYAMANEGGQTLGARGQGKFVFVSASKRNVIVYDTRKVNGKYRVGYTTISVGESDVFAFDGEEGKKWIREELGIEPVHEATNNFGSRIMIIDPSDELVKRLRSGVFLEHIQETWWPFIRDFGARIEVVVDGVTTTATVPDLIKELRVGQDTVDSKFWKKDDLSFRFGQWKGNQYSIKELRFASVSSSDLPDAYKGIAVFRGGMKVQAVQPLYGYDFEGRITGYVILDSKCDEKLREVEKPSHYEFNNSGIWKKIEALIKEQAQIFGAEKLGIGISTLANPEEQRQASVSKAFQIFHFLSKDWPLELTNGGCGGGGGGGGGGLKKICYVAMKDFVFPNPANVARLDWGQAISGWWLELGNGTSSAINIQLECVVSSASGKLFEFAGRKISLAANSVFDYRGGKDSDLKILADKNIFPGPGRYKIVVTMTDVKTKKIIDETSRLFWLEMDPPLRAPFDMQPAAFSTVLPEQVELEWKLELRDGGNIVYYNIDHPSFAAAAKQKNDAVFLGEVAGMAGVELVIRNVSTIAPEEARSKKLPFDYDLLFGKDPVGRYLETIKMRDLIRHKILSNYLT